MEIVGQEKPDINDLAQFGVKGMHWGVRKNQDLKPLNEGLSNRQYRKNRLHNEAVLNSQADVKRKALEKQTGVQYRKDTSRIAYQNTGKLDPNKLIKKHYSDSEIKAARLRVTAGHDALNAAMVKAGMHPDGKGLNFNTKVQKLYAKQLESPDRLVAEYKTRGEKAVGLVINGPAGYFKVADVMAVNRLATTRNHPFTNSRLRSVTKQIKTQNK